jgi:hypothetical protein
MAECEYFVKSWRKPDQILVERCSLTGRGCFCEGVTYLTCTRRTFALDYDKRHPKRLFVDPIVTVVCSEDSPKPPLPSP